MTNTLESSIQAIVEEKPYKIILSKPKNKNELYKKTVIELHTSYYQISRYTEKQVFHENIQLSQLRESLLLLTTSSYLQLNGWSESYELTMLMSKKGTVTLKKKQLSGTASIPVTSTHNRVKNYILQEGVVIPPLVDMGIFTKDGKIVRSMYDKFKQINRFIELVNDEMDSIHSDEPFHIIDFGCGKSYLTFILYYYFSEIKKVPVSIVGLDLKEDVIKKCNLAAQKYGYTNLHFELGDINGYHTDHPVDMVVTLHACDTATDYALMNAISWNAKFIFSVPCCQHEWNKTMQSDSLSILSRYGIIQERFSALATDSVRANLLECCGYKTQLLEFVDFESTPKNLLIRAKRKPLSSKNTRMKYFHEVDEIMNTFHVSPTLFQLLQNNGYLEDFQ